MTGSDKEIVGSEGRRKILLVGDASKAFLDLDAVGKNHYEVCADMAEAIAGLPAANGFAAIAVVISGISARLNSALKTIRDRCNAKIILLAQIYEEPIAIQLVSSARNGVRLADDYLICPVEPDRLYESVTHAPGRSIRLGEPPSRSRTVEAAATTTAQETPETRIRQLERLATEDDLTGLKNRRYIREFARQIVERARAENGRVTLLVFDIDDFKHYNDQYGHRTGDEILKQAAALMRRCCRGHDVVARIGGDEFAVVFWDDPKLAKSSNVARASSPWKPSGPQSPIGAPADDDRQIPPGSGPERRSAYADHPREAIFIAKRFVRELEKAGLSSFGVLGAEGKGLLTISGGLASFPRDANTSDELFLQADRALLDAKRSGKNRIYLVGKPQNNITDIK